MSVLPSPAPQPGTARPQRGPTTSAADDNPLGRRALLAGSALAVPALVGALGTARAHADSGGAPYDPGSYAETAGLSFADGFPVPREDLRSVDFRVHTDKVKTFPPSFRVTLPVGYEADADRHYPVLVMLHGQGGNFLGWTEEGGNVLEETEDKDVIVISPDGGGGSFYSNANYPLPGREAAWETFIMEQILPFVHENFRTDPERMAIAGLSMGGWGALALGQKYHGHFRSVSSYSGPADCRTLGADGKPIGQGDGAGVAAAIWACPVVDAERYLGKHNYPGATWGTHLRPPIASTYNPIENIERYRDKRVFLRTGDGAWLDLSDILEGFPQELDELLGKLEQVGVDSVEAAVHPNLERFAGALGDAGIDHDFQLLPGRTHEWGLWRENFAEDIPGIMEALEA